MVKDSRNILSSGQSGCRHRLPACILIYATSQCIFCPGAKEILERMLEEHDLQVDSVTEVDCDSEECKGITVLPTIQICQETINGLPEEDTLNRALWRLRVTPCFYKKHTIE